MVFNLTPTVVSGVPQGNVLGPLLFSLYINDIPVGIDYQIRLFADDCVCYREIIIFLFSFTSISRLFQFI